MARKKAATNGKQAQFVTSAEVDDLKSQFIVEEALSLDDGSDEIVVRINEQVVKRVARMTQVLATSRGVKDPDTITAADSEVMAAVSQEIDEREDHDLRGIFYTARRGKRLNKRDQKRYDDITNRHLERIRSRYRPQFTVLEWLVRVCCMILDDVFTIEKSGNITSRFDYIPDEAYWENGGVDPLETGNDPFLALIDSYAPPPLQIVVDRSNANEIMMGVAFAILKANPHFDRSLKGYVEQLMGFEWIADKNMEGVELDTFQFLRNQLSAFLYQSDGESDSADEWTRPVVRVQPPDGLVENVSGPEPAGEKV